MNSTLKNQLVIIAKDYRKAELPNKNWCKEEIAWQSNEAWAVELTGFMALAHLITGRLILDDDECASIFFEDGAIQYLKKVPNLYWFWTLVEESANYSMNSKAKIKIKDILFVVENKFRKELIDQNIRLDRSIHVVSPTEACYLLEKGVVLLKQEGGRIILERNPVFELR